MAEILTPIQTALGEAFMGNTQSAKTLFPSSPQTFDARLIALLQGIGQLDETLLPDAIAGSDLAGFLRAFGESNQSERLLEVLRLRTQFVPFGVFQQFPALSGEAGFGASPSGTYIDTEAVTLSISVPSPSHALISAKIDFAPMPAALPIASDSIYSHIEVPAEFNEIFDFIYSRQPLENDSYAASSACVLASSTTVPLYVASPYCRLSTAGSRRIFLNAQLVLKVSPPSSASPASSLYYSAIIPLAPAP